MSFGRQIASYGFGLVVSKLQLFALLLIVPQFLSPEEYGVFDVITSLTFLVSILATLNLDTAVGNHYNDLSTPEGRRRLIGTATWTNIVFGAIAIVALGLTSSYVSVVLFGTQQLAGLITLAGISAVLTGILTAQLGYLRYRFLIREHNTIQILSSIFIFVLTIVLIANLRWGVYGVVIGSLVGTLLALFVSLYYNRAEVRARPGWLTARTLLQTGLALMPFTIASWALAFIDRGILLRFRPVDEVGIYGLAVRYAQAVLLLFAPFQSAWLPYALANWRREDAPALFGRVLRLFVAVGGVALLALGPALQLVILLLLPTSFHAASRYVSVLMLCNLLAALYYFPWVLLMMRKKPWVASFGYLLGAAVNVGLNFAFVPTFGVAAAAWATFIGYAIMLVVTTALAYYFSRWPYPYCQVGVFIALLFALTAVSFAVPVIQPVQVLALGAGAMLVFLAAVWLGGLVDVGEARAFVRARLKIR